MRSLIVNKKPFYALNYKGVVDVRDSEGNLTGEKTIEYTKAFKVKANLSGAKGSSQSEVFGTDIHYDKTFTLSNDEFNKLKLTENSVFFIDKKVEYENGQPLYNYRVKKIADVINDVAIAIERV